MRVWIVQTGEPLHIDGAKLRSMRAMNLADVLVSRGHNVIVWSTSFFHQEKRHRFKCDTVVDFSDQLQFRLIASMGYQRNIGVKRFADHIQLGRRFTILAGRVPMPDVAFVGFPPVEIAASAVRLCCKANVPVLLDIKDLWPDLFEDPFPPMARRWVRRALAPLHRLTVEAINSCDGICAPSSGFLSWARSKGTSASSADDIVAPLTSHHPKIDEVSQEAADTWWDRAGVPADGRLRATFVGSFSRSFDLDCVVQAATSGRGSDWQWVLCGDGERLERIRRAAAGHPNITLPGWIDRAKLESLLRRSTVGLAPYRSIPNFELNVCNKVYDYLHSGLPVLSPLGGDVRQLLLTDGVGLCYRAGDPESLLDALDDARRSEWHESASKAARAVYRARYDPEVVYAQLAAHLERVGGR
jgi:glycosyltransferase involved in cell wall biosynthesis